MAKGFCSSCGKEVGTFFKPAGYQCRNCMQVFCFACSKKIGFILKTPICPNCGIELVQSVRRAELRDEHQRAIAFGRGMEEGRRRAIEDERERRRTIAEGQKFVRDTFGIGEMFQPPRRKKR
jgi:DNA-directed RNA polymerase subunit RPC12/RpoP